MTDLLEVVVRSSSGSSADVVCTLAGGATVLELKKQVSEKHPAHPPAENQRLIFCGRILNNGDLVSDLGKSLEAGTRLTVILWFRTSPATPPASPSPPPQPAQTYAAAPNMPFPPNQPYQAPLQGAPAAYFMQGQGFQPMGHGRPMWAMGGAPGFLHHHQVPQFNQQVPPHFHQPQQQAFQGYPGNAFPHGFMPGMMPNQQPMQQQQQPAVRMRVARINLSWMFGALLLAIFVLIQGGPNAYLYSAILITVAFLYMRPRGGAQQGNAAAPNGNDAGGGNGVAGGNGAAGNQLNRDAQRNGNGNGNGNGFDDLEHDPNIGEDVHSVPSILRYDWRHHRGPLGEILGFVCPLLFSLWPSWDPSILGDHPDVIRRRQDAQNPQNNAPPAPAPAPANDAPNTGEHGAPQSPAAPPAVEQ